MKKFLLGTVGLIALSMSAPASAADIAARPYTKAPPMVAAIYDWSGFYIGANGGWGSSRNCGDALSVAGTFVNSEGCHDATGAVAGGQLGYRWQSSAFVFGVEAQGDWADLSGRNQIDLAPAFTNRTRINAFGLFTGQIGYAWNNALLYVKGGAAVTDGRFDVFISPNGVPANALVGTSGDQTRWGGTVGVGLEYGFAPNWSAAVEYDHLFMGNRNVTLVNAGISVPAGAFLQNERIRQDVDLVTVRVNYRWGGPVIAKY
jgi:outer membrane immunogenic protein